MMPRRWTMSGSHAGRVSTRPKRALQGGGREESSWGPPSDGSSRSCKGGWRRTTEWEKWCWDGAPPFRSQDGLLNKGGGGAITIDSNTKGVNKGSCRA